MTDTQETPKQQLNQVYILDCRINSKLQELETLEATVNRVTSWSTSERVQGGNSGREDLICRLVDLRTECNEAIDAYVDYRDSILRTIDLIEDPLLAEILIERYVERQTWEQIAINTHFDVRHIYRLHGKALEAYKDVMVCHSLT